MKTIKETNLKRQHSEYWEGYNKALKDVLGLIDGFFDEMLDECMEEKKELKKQIEGK